MAMHELAQKTLRLRLTRGYFVLLFLWSVVGMALFLMLNLKEFDAQILYARVGTLIFGLLAAILVFLTRKSVAQTVCAFFDEATTPFNLGVFRIILAAFILAKYCPSQDDMAFLLRQDPVLRWPPDGFRLLGLWDALDFPNLYLGLTHAYRLALILAVLGLFSRSSMLAVGVLGFFVLGVYQHIGTITRIQNLLWFPLVLAFSRCGDALSVDAIIHAVGRADRGQLDPPAASKYYAWPLRWIWLLMGVIYFFPGFWKLWNCGFPWCNPDLLRYHLYHRWYTHGGWLPIIRVDHFEPMLIMMGYFTFVLEIGAVFAFIKGGWLRAVATFTAFIFTVLTLLFFNINFFHVGLAAFSFVNWYALARWFNRRMQRTPLVVVFDGHCKLCRRTIAIWKSLALGSRIVFISAMDRALLREHNLDQIDEAELARNMHAVSGSQTASGFDAYRLMVKYTPLLWWTLPLLYLPPIVAIGRIIYRRVADGRTCSVVRSSHMSPRNEEGLSGRLIRPWLVHLVGAALVLGASVAGATSHWGWPFAVYPKFDAMITTPTKYYLRVDVVDDKGNGTSLDYKPVVRILDRPRAEELMKLAIERPFERERVPAVARLFMDAHGLPRDGTHHVRVYSELIDVRPTSLHQPPLSRELLFEGRL